MTRIIIIGGSDAGISAALRIREVAPATTVSIFVADRYPNFSICGLPYYLSGEVPDWRTLAHRTVTEITATGIDLHLDALVTAIDPHRHTVTVRTANGSTTEHYDQLIIGTGAKPRTPAITGYDLPGVFLLHTMDDSFAINSYLEQHQPRHVTIVGGGYIGLEMTEALRHRDIAVTLVYPGPTPLKTVDDAFGTFIAAAVVRHAVTIAPATRITTIERAGTRLQITGTAGFSSTTDMVILAVGVQPETSLARAIGLRLGAGEAINVTAHMATAIPDIYAAGDCVVTHHRLFAEPIYLPLGTTAHKQGRVAGENAAGGRAVFHGSVGTQVVKVFDHVIARTGLLEAEASAYKPLTVALTTWDHKVYYPQAQPLQLRLTADRHTHRLLGAQVLGHIGSEVSKRVDIFATALFCDLTVEHLLQLDLSYTPPLSSPWDPTQMVAQAWLAAT